jgi:hypothetical protein
VVAAESGALTAASFAQSPDPAVSAVALVVVVESQPDNNIPTKMMFSPQLLIFTIECPIPQVGFDSSVFGRKKERTPPIPLSCGRGLISFDGISLSGDRRRPDEAGFPGQVVTFSQPPSA